MSVRAGSQPLILLESYSTAAAKTLWINVDEQLIRTIRITSKHSDHKQTMSFEKRELGCYFPSSWPPAVPSPITIISANDQSQ